MLCFPLPKKNTDYSALDINVTGVKVLQSVNTEIHFMYHRDNNRYNFRKEIRIVYDLVAIYRRHFKILNVIWNLFCYSPPIGMHLQQVRFAFCSSSSISLSRVALF